MVIGLLCWVLDVFAELLCWILDGVASVLWRTYRSLLGYCGRCDVQREAWFPAPQVNFCIMRCPKCGDGYVSC